MGDIEKAKLRPETMTFLRGLIRFFMNIEQTWKI
jgi:hypothetical protein